MLEEFDDMPIHPVHNTLLSNEISKFVIKETKQVLMMQNTISGLLKDEIIKKNIQIQFDTTQLEEMRNQYHSNTFTLQQHFQFDDNLNNNNNQYNNINNININKDNQLIQDNNEPQLIHNISHIEIYSDIIPYNYRQQYELEIQETSKKMPDLIKKIKKRVKIDQMKERFYLNRARNNMTAWLYEQIKPFINDERQINGKGGGSAGGSSGGSNNSGFAQKQKLKRDLQSISNYDKKNKSNQNEVQEGKITYSHILNVQSILEMQYSFFPPKKTYPIKLYYPIKDNCCNESAILPPQSKVKVIRMQPKRLEENNFDYHLGLGSTFIIKIKNLLQFFQLVTLKGSDFVYISNQMDMDYFQVKVLYDFVSKVFKLSKVHKEQRRRNLQKKDRVQVKMQEIKQHLKNIFKDLYEENKIETLFQTEELFLTYGDIQTRVNKYFHPINSSEDLESIENNSHHINEKNISHNDKNDKHIDKYDKYDSKDKDEDYDDGETYKAKKQRKGKQSSLDVRGANTRSNQSHKSSFFFS